MRKVPNDVYDREARIAEIHRLARNIPTVFRKKVNYMPSSRLAEVANDVGFTPMYVGSIGRFNIKYK